MSIDGDATGWIFFGLWVVGTWLATRLLLRRFERWFIARREERRRERERIEDELDELARQDLLEMLGKEDPSGTPRDR